MARVPCPSFAWPGRDAACWKERDEGVDDRRLKTHRISLLACTPLWKGIYGGKRKERNEIWSLGALTRSEMMIRRINITYRRYKVFLGSQNGEMLQLKS